MTNNMASEAYLKTLKEIPKDIQDDVIGSINIANEIYFALKQKGINPAELARRLDKSESEISKWLTGLHNFTFKTVRKIESVLEIKLIVTNSSKIEEYERKLIKANKKLNLLERKLNSIKEKENLGYHRTKIMSLKHSFMESDSLKDNFYKFLIDDEAIDNVKLQPESKYTFWQKTAN